MWNSSTPVAKAVGNKKASQLERIQAAEAYLNTASSNAVSIQDDLQYLGCSARQITQNIINKKNGWTASRVMEAFVRSAIRTHEQLNCLTEIMFVKALDRAHQLDKEFAATGQPKGPLHGVPVSIKDPFYIEGEDATIGFTRLINKPSTHNAPIVDLLIEAGAIPFAKTNVPQTMLSFECSNPLFGTTRNPYNQRFTCGGSSGGEAALIASDASPLGIGSDVGGSLRIPAHFSGCCALKPSGGRFISWAATSPTPGFRSLIATAGVMGRCIDDLEFASQVIFDAHSSLWKRFQVVPLPWRKVEPPRRLKIGYYTNDGIAKASPACQRAVEETVKALTAAGHTCVPIDVERLQIERALLIFGALTCADGYKTLLSGLGPDPREASLFLLTWGPRLPMPIRALLSWVFRRVVGDNIVADIIWNMKARSTSEVWKWQAKQDVHCERVRRYLWQELQLDGVICPTSAMPAMPIGSTWSRSVLAIATFVWNVCDTTVAQLPVTSVRETDVPTPEWESQPIKSPMIHRALYGKEGVGIYDPSNKGMLGLPVGIQLVGATWEEEKVCAMARVVEDVLKKRQETESFGPGKYVLGQNRL